MLIVPYASAYVPHMFSTIKLVLDKNILRLRLVSILYVCGMCPTELNCILHKKCSFHFFLTILPFLVVTLLSVLFSNSSDDHHVVICVVVPQINLVSSARCVVR